MPLEIEDPDDDSPLQGGARFGGSRVQRPRSPWWRPAGTVGRVFLGLGLLAILGGLATSYILLKTFLGRDPRFRIEGASNIQATGLTEVSRAQMLPVFGEDIGRNIFFIPLTERRQQLEQIPWVERATVMRLLPDQIRVQVVERQPVAFARQGQQFGLVDASGVLLTMPAAAMAERHYSFPVVTGIDDKTPAAIRKARMAVYMRMLAELDANHQKLSEQISEVDLTDPEDARVLMPEQGADILAHFGEDHFLERYQRYKAHIAEWRQQYPKLSAVDLRYDQQVVLQMTPGTNTVEPATGDSSAAKAGEGTTASETAHAEPEKKPVQAGASPALPAKAASHQPASGKAQAGKPEKAKPAATAKSTKTGAKAAIKAAGKAGGKTAGKPKTATKTVPMTAKEKTARIKAANLLELEMKRAAEATPPAQNTKRRNSTPTTHTVAVAAEGQ
jgi:cell division protein FtsQ